MLTGRTIIDDPSIYILMHYYKAHKHKYKANWTKGLLKFVDSRCCIKSAIFWWQVFPYYVMPMGVTFSAIGMYDIVKVVCDSRIHSWGQGFGASMQGERERENVKNSLSFGFLLCKKRTLKLASRPQISLSEIKLGSFGHEISRDRYLSHPLTCCPKLT